MGNPKGRQVYLHRAKMWRINTQINTKMKGNRSYQTSDGNGSARLEYDLELSHEDGWRIHPSFPEHARDDPQIHEPHISQLMTSKKQGSLHFLQVAEDQIPYVGCFILDVVVAPNLIIDNTIPKVLGGTFASIPSQSTLWHVENVGQLLHSYMSVLVIKSKWHGLRDRVSPFTLMHLYRT